MQIEYAPHFEEESRTQGCNSAIIRAGQRVAELYADDDDRVDVREVEQTKTPKFRSWYRLKIHGQQIRVAVELVAEDTVLVHAVLPRYTDTYDEIQALWKKHRTQL
jgi:hypothetical protein